MTFRPLYTAVDKTGSRTIGTPVVNGTHIRTVLITVALRPGTTTTTAFYTTVIGGIPLTGIEFGQVTKPPSTDGAMVDQFVTFIVDAGATYGITRTLGAGVGASATIKSWVEIDAG